MSKFDPERDGWGLSEAVMRTAHRGMLAALHRNMIDATGLTYEPIEWWSYTLAPPAAPPRHPPRPIDNLFMLHQESGRRWLIMQGSIETDFLHKLYSGELTCWGRLESSLAPYVRAPPGAITGIESWWKGGGILRLGSGELFYAARVEPTATDRLETNRGGRPPLPYRAEVMGYIFDWLDQEGERPKPEIKAAMVKFIAKIDDQGGPSDSTLKTWANEALAEYRRRCEAGARKPVSASS